MSVEWEESRDGEIEINIERKGREGEEKKLGKRGCGCMCVSRERECVEDRDGERERKI